MASYSRTMILTMLLFVLHVASVRGVTMAARDKAALMAVREAIENKEDFPPIECNIYFECSTSGRVISVFLFTLGLKGRIAPEIGNLTELSFLALYNNQLSGSIPSSIGKLKFLNKIFLNNNKLSGSIPSSTGNLRNLIQLWLYDNQLTGGLPSSIGNLTNLKYFDISNNYFIGPIRQVENHPSCYELASNCLFGSNLPKGCKSNGQRSKKGCLSFCNATQVGGPCGGKGVCSFSTNWKKSTCACNKGYNNKASKYTCK